MNSLVKYDNRFTLNDSLGHEEQFHENRRRNLFHRLNSNEVCIHSPNVDQSKTIKKCSSISHSFQEFNLVSILPETLFVYHKISFASQSLLRYNSSFHLLDTYSSLLNEERMLRRDLILYIAFLKEMEFVLCLVLKLMKLKD